MKYGRHEILEWAKTILIVSVCFYFVGALDYKFGFWFRKNVIYPMKIKYPSSAHYNRPHKPLLEWVLAEEDRLKKGE